MQTEEAYNNFGSNLCRRCYGYDSSESCAAEIIALVLDKFMILM